MSSDTHQAESDQMFYAAEQAGLKLAIKGRIVTVVFFTILMSVTRDAERVPDYILGGLLFVALGLLHFRIIGSSFDRPWVKYVFISIDILLLSAAVAFLPAEPETPVPQVMIFRFQILPFYFLILAVAAFSFSPGLVLWSGVAGAAGWMAAFVYIRSGMERTLEWSDIPTNPTPEEFLTVFLDVDFVASGTRMQEATIFFVVATLIAIVMRRARGVVRRQLEAERGVAAISQLFGRFVPKAVADSMIQHEGALEPLDREATVLIADVAGFTALTETRGAQAIVDTFNAYFEAASKVIGTHDGVVTQFIGDAVLATFNVPAEDPEHRQHGIDAAVDLLELVRSNTFAGERLTIRVGVSTGPVIAGNVGGGGRATYTVYGEAVNLASRLEALNKEQGTSFLVSGTTAEGAKVSNLAKVGQVDVRGIREPVDIYTLA
ncbi:MAG: adenylate/guanylate cyclase domain-containing protein [Pseudomonadota bacterium]